MNLSIKSYSIMVLGACWAILPLAAPAQVGGSDIYQALVKREFGSAIKEMEAIEKEIQDAKPAQYPQIEARLIAVVESPEATAPGKQFACQMLRIVGSPKCIPAVSKLLADDKLSHMARNVFLGMHDAAVDEALRKALGQTEGKLRIGIVNTIGDRGDRQSLQLLAALLKNNDEAASLSALNAIGKIGGVQAADVLDAAKVASPLQAAWAHAYLRCADGLAAAGQSSRSAKMFQALFNGPYLSAIRAAAFPAVVREQKERAVPVLVKTLLSEDAIMKRAAASAMSTVPGNAATKAIVGELPRLEPEGKVVLLGALALRGDSQGITDAINKLAMDENMTVRQAAVKALAKLGNAASIPMLVVALKEGGTLGPDANKSLAELQGKGVDEALVKQAEDGDVVVRQAMLKVLADRGQVDALPAFRKAVNDPDPKIRRAALKTLAALGTKEDLARLLGMLMASKDDSERGQIAQAIAEIGGRVKDPAARCEPILTALPKADVPTKAALLGVLASWGGDTALQAVRTSLTGDAEVKKAAIRSLAEWPDPAPMPDLLVVAKDGTDKSDQILALRGYVRLAGLTGGRAKIPAYREAMGAAIRPEEKWLVLAGLGEVAQVESLKMVEPCLEDDALKREAFVAYEKIAESLAGRQPAAAREALQRVVDKTNDNGLRNKARAALDKMKR